MELTGAAQPCAALVACLVVLLLGAGQGRAAAPSRVLASARTFDSRALQHAPLAITQSSVWHNPSGAWADPSAGQVCGARHSSQLSVLPAQMRTSALLPLPRVQAEEASGGGVGARWVACSCAVPVKTTPVVLSRPCA